MSELQIEDVGQVRVLRMNRPEKRNALNNAPDAWAGGGVGGGRSR